MKKKGGLGRGLDVFFSEPAQAAPETSGELRTVPILSVDPNPHQPRRSFDPEKLQELADSIAEHGILQPPVAVQRGERYHLVAGERRWRAARQAGLTEIPIRVMELSDRQIAEISLIENLQRDDLNPMEEAAGIQALMQDFSLTQEEAAKRLGKSRSAVANAVRLLRLPAEVSSLVREGSLSAGHARVLAGLEDKKQVLDLAQRAVKEGLNVRQMEEYSRQEGKKSRKNGKNKKVERDPQFEEFTRLLQDMMGTKVTVNGDLDAGKIIVEYYSRTDLERIWEIAMRASGEEA